MRATWAQERRHPWWNPGGRSQWPPKPWRHPEIERHDRLAALLRRNLLGAGRRRHGLIHRSVVAVTQHDRFMLLANCFAFLKNLGFDLGVAIIRDLK